MTVKIETYTDLTPVDIGQDILTLYFSLVANGHLQETSIDKFREMIFSIEKKQAEPKESEGVGKAKLQWERDADELAKLAEDRIK